MQIGFAFGRFGFDAVERRLFLDGREVARPLRELELLAHFLEHPAEWLGDSLLERRLWPKAVPPTGELDRLIRALTATLDEGADGVTTIQAVKGRGYRLLIPVRGVGEAAGGAPGSEGGRASEPLPAAPNGASTTGASAAPTPAPVPVSPPAQVLPTPVMRASSGERGPATPALPGRSAHRSLIPPRQLAIGLGVALAVIAVVFGLRWIVRAVSGGSDGAAGSSATVASAAQLRAAAAAELEKGIAAARGYDLASRRAAIRHFEAALQLDTGSRNQAVAHAALANVLVLESDMERARLEAQAALAANIALGYEAKLAEPLAALAFAQLFASRDPAAARASAERVLGLDALHVLGRRALVWVHAVEGRFATALAELAPLLQAGEFDPEVATDEGWMLYLSGRPTEARQRLAAVVRLEPAFRRAHAALAAVHLSERRLAAAAVELELLDALEEGATRYDERVRLLAHGDWMMPDASEAARLLEERAVGAAAQAAGGSVGPETEAARIYAQFGESALAMAALGRAFARREAEAVLARIDPAFAPLRSSAAFRKLLDGAGVPPLAPATPAP